VGTAPVSRVMTGQDTTPASTVAYGTCHAFMVLRFVGRTAQTSGLATAASRYPRSGPTVARRPRRPGPAARCRGEAARPVRLA
jgi:hypothetical protein